MTRLGQTLPTCTCSCIEKKDWKSKSLSEHFPEIFKSFTKDNFAAHPSTIKRVLHDLLRGQGVYVPRERIVMTADALHQAVEEYLP